jgi:hypothetical protein
MTVGWYLKRFFTLLVCLLLLNQSIYLPQSLVEKVSAYTGGLEFDYVGWTLNALTMKAGLGGIAPTDHVDVQVQKKVVTQYFDLVKQYNVLEAQVEQIYADPAVKDPAAAAKDQLTAQTELQKMLDRLAPVAEAILQQQVTTVLQQNKLTLGGQPIPSVLYHTTPLPKALIVSPRDVVRQDVNISLLANLTLDQISELEATISKNLDVSVLVVDIGGVGVYPTMVQRTSNFEWVLGTIAHEWTHNYLAFRPLGWNYDTNNQLRTMNETTASIVGNEIGAQVMQEFYPNYTASTVSPAASGLKAASLNVQTDTFDFNHEMHETRVKVDELLKAGKIEEAETYMEQRRQVFVQHGYLIRKLNQAYFAFYGAYADTPGGAAGEDPVGPAVRALRTQSTSLADFLNQISWMTSFEQLQKAVKP